MERSNDRAFLSGIAAAEPEKSHEVKDGAAFYRFPLDVERLSGAVDRVNVIVRAETLELCPVREGDPVTLSGEVRSYNNRSGVGARLVIYVLARELRIEFSEPKNEIYLSGVLVKEPTYRRTPMGREISDIMLAVPRRYRRSDYLPIIVWGARARETADWSVGAEAELKGRLQMRKYIKIEDGAETEKTAYEVSASEISLI